MSQQEISVINLDQLVSMTYRHRGSFIHLQRPAHVEPERDSPSVRSSSK